MHVATLWPDRHLGRTKVPDMLSATRWSARTALAIMIMAVCVAAVLLGSPGAIARSAPHARGRAVAPSLLNVPVPPPIRGMKQALADRPDPVSRRSARSAAAAVPSGGWQPLGPAPIGPPYLSGGGFYGGANSGRITALVSLASGLHPGRVVAGTAGGGIWTTDNSGTTWSPRTDYAANLAIGAMAADPSNPNHLIAGTGEANQCADCFAGNGVLVSTNGGDTWTLQNPSGVFAGLHVAQMAIDPANSSHEFAATDAGLFVTTNGGTSWAKPTDATYAAVDGSITSVVINPTTPTIVYIGGGAKTVAKSTDGGVHWAAANTSIAAPGPSPLTALAIAASSPTTLYASVGSVNPVVMYKSTNSGANWTKLTATPDFTGQGYAYGSGSSEQGWYDNVLAVDPTNANHVLAGGIALIATTNGGTSWTNVNGQSFFGGGVNKFHPDQHALVFRSDGSVWTGDDGGAYSYTPSSGAVANINGHLNITQFYFGFNVVGTTLLAGAQDNSSARTSSSVQSPWTGISSGDGGPSAITSNSTQTQFIESDEHLYVTTDGFASTNTDITPPTSSLFTPPMSIVPNASTPANPTVFYGGLDLWRTTNPTTGPTWSQVTSVGANVSAVTSAPSNPQVIYVGFTDGTIQVSTNGGTSFTSLATEPIPSETFVTGLSVNPTNPKAITASFSYNDTRYTAGLPHVAQYTYTTTPGSGTWTVITGNLPHAAVSRVVYDNNALVAATDVGVYATGSPSGSSTAWTRVGTALPNVQVQDLYVVSNAIYAVTHGRGAWRLPPQAELAVHKTGPASVAKGATVSYTVIVTNGGPAPATTTKLTDAVPAGTTFLSESQSQGPAFTCTNPAAGGTGTSTCTIASLASGVSATLHFTYTVPASTSLTSVSNTAQVSSAIADPYSGDNTSTVTTMIVSPSVSTTTVS
jgi:uncharacterized repeat protein (TIGR01451 family)